MIALERARQHLLALGLKDTAEALDAHLERAAKREVPYADFLADLLEAELAVRRRRYLDTRTKLARLPFRKTLDDFDFEAQPSVDRCQVRELATLQFLAHAENVILLGPPGVGKTHVAVALGLAAIDRGYAVYFTPMHRLVEDLRNAYEEHRLDRRMRIYLAPRLLIIDELGYLPLDRVGATVFFQLVAARYERGSIILTSNQTFADWGEVFGDPVIATAILDRLLHHSHVINIRGESYRLREKRRAGLFRNVESKPET
ncbi:MAG: IS21-like element helper ATPase IstB [Armatimonadota bacterium]|nr:IS21-like element helper ATPase IstB [Armatimonadota bacterium]MDR7566930.1 IS21-like element helper ATPase IstB [Armatimonadota bacterium]